MKSLFMGLSEADNDTPFILFANSAVRNKYLLEQSASIGTLLYKLIEQTFVLV
jgi:hypothetical protein